MRDFFSLEGSFNKYAGFFSDMVILSFVWIFFSIPIFTIGAATTALFYVSTRRLSNREGYITSDFWHSFKANFKRATLIWLAIFAIFFIVLLSTLIGYFEPELMETMGALSWIVLPLQLVALLQIVFITIFIFPVIARFDMSVKDAIKYSFFIGNRHFLTSVACLLITFSLTVVPVAFPIVLPVLLLAPGIYAMLASVMIMKIFRKYRPEIDPDPMLELQELEKERTEKKRRAELNLPEEKDEA
jgi:uncharacterized membrane protein YesL